MATLNQRITAIADALINGVATEQQKVRLVNGWLGKNNRSALNGTQAEMAQAFLSGVYKDFRRDVREYEGRVAGDAARIAAMNGVNDDLPDLEQPAP